MFISSERVVRVRERSQKFTLGTWTWDGDEPVATTRQLLQSAVDARVKEATDAAHIAIAEASLKTLRGDRSAVEELYAVAREHLQRVASDLWWPSPEFAFNLLRKMHDEMAAASFAREERECESLCLLAHRTRHRGNGEIAAFYTAQARACLSEIGQDDQFDRINAAAAGALASELEEERRKSLLSDIPLARVIKRR